MLGSGALGFDWTHPADCNVYAIDTGDGVVIVDSGTGRSVNAILEHMRQYGFEREQVSDILLTHLHADHSGGAAALREATGASVAVLALAAGAMQTGDEKAISLAEAREAGFYEADYRWRPCPVDRRLDDGDKVVIGECAFTVMHTPGHSRFDTCYFMERPGRPPVLMSGDTVMYGGKISMLNTYDFNLRELAASMDRLAAMTPGMLLPGHGQPALSRAAEHVRRAHLIFQNLGIPANIG